MFRAWTKKTTFTNWHPIYISPRRCFFSLPPLNACPIVATTDVCRFYLSQLVQCSKTSKGCVVSTILTQIIFGIHKRVRSRRDERLRQLLVFSWILLLNNGSTWKEDRCGDRSHEVADNILTNLKMFSVVILHNPLSVSVPESRGRR